MALDSGSILIYGGVSMTHSPLPDLFLLKPSSAGTWTWQQIVTSDHSMTSPSLAWHTADLVQGGTIIVAFGIDASSAAPSNTFWFLTVDEASGTYTWQDTFDGNEAAVTGASASATSTTSKLARRKPVEYIHNPKASTDSPAPAQTSTPAWTGGGSGNYGAGNGEAVTSAAAVASAPPVAKSSSAYSATLAKSSSVVAAAAPSTSSSSDNSSSSSSTIIGASIGAIGGAVALAGLAFFILRRRAASQMSAPSTPMMGYSSGSAGADGGAPFVSQLMYTRPSQKRNMSLGSTVSALSPRVDSIPPQSPAEAIPDHAGQNLAGLGARGVGADPFADTYRVNEVGQLERSSSQVSGVSSTNGVVGATSTPSKSSPLKASVQSIPFLSSITGGPAVTENDVYTSPAPTLSAKRSLRRPSQNLPPLPVPGTPAELIGVAITSDDGHDDPSGLPYLSSSASAPQTSWDPAQEIRPVTPAMGRKSVDEGKAGDLPPSLRPGTPLRVANPDPFVDQ